MGVYIITQNGQLIKYLCKMLNRIATQAASSLIWRPCGNQGDPAVGVRKNDAPSDKCKKRGRGQRLPEVGGTHKSDEAWYGGWSKGVPVWEKG
jgi:hypothetical protein